MTSLYTRSQRGAGTGCLITGLFALPFVVIVGGYTAMVKGATLGIKKIKQAASKNAETAKDIYPAASSAVVSSDTRIKTALVLIADALFFPAGAVLLGVWYHALPQKTRSTLVIATVFISICAIVGYIFVGHIALDVYRESLMTA